MEYQIINIIFSIILLPVNFCSAFWLFQEAMNLTGMTFKEFLATTSSEVASLSTGRHAYRKRQRFLVRFFKEKSSDPQKSIQLLWTFGICTLPGLAALSLAVYSAMHIDKLKYAFIGNIVLVAINIALAIWGKIYRKNHPMDDLNAERFNQKRMKEKEEEKRTRGKSIVVYTLAAAFFLGIFLVIILQIIGSTQAQQQQQSPQQQSQQAQQTVVEIQSDLITILNEKGYETANIPTTYWDIDEDKLLHVAAGIKGDSKFEFYGYSDNETVDLVYNQIVYQTAPNIEPSERESHETVFSDGSKMFTIVMDGVHYLVMYKNDTVIYAYSSDSLDEINEILTDIGYL